ncbi:EI24 domain-containing protein [Paracoccus sp. TK19116]|uniref:EI24 domain-containing protein n=1 Tax=Paracoccus albicereus TaxID=2922394 RepID=A0ABT1MWE7_9RHOB|nr:EI24 domain-containing protein [Paracoccus albicereus]MCQ0971176.1 EI24 domain-containing protein [Paracoccus albicereus]
MNATRAILSGWGDLLRPRILGLVLLSMVLTLVLFVAFQAGIVFLLRAFVPGSISVPFLGSVDLGDTLGWGSLALFPVMGFFLMAPVAAAFCGLFAERVADAVEAQHYPETRGQSLDFADGLLESLAVGAAVLGVAIVSLILMPVLGPFAPVFFYGVNGWLLGREFFQMAARRHLAEPQATALRKANATTVTWTGVMIAFLLTVPVVNVAIPALAAATFTHLFHLTARRSRSTPRYPRE